MFISHLFRSLVAAVLPTADAHCDTADGPSVIDGRRALETGNLNYALKWIPADGEDELRAVFDKAMRVRGLSPDAAELADRLFLETMVRIHRMAEGVGFTGIQPTGAAVDPVVVAADRALESGDDAGLRDLVPADRWEELHRRFGEALARRDHDVNDVAAGREFMEAYVSFFKYAEGEDHDHHGHGGHAPHGHGGHAPHGHGGEHAHAH